jgi:DNA-binding transcriptional regulator YiaG/uncharacterized DUF497 family protein
MDFAWDPAKNAWNIQHRRLPFALAALLFSGPTLEWQDDRLHYGEVRCKALGLVHGRVLLCVYTDRITAGREVRWIISLREAERKGSDAYYARSMAGLLDEMKDFAMPPKPDDHEVEKQAAADPDAPPTTDEELARAEVVAALLRPEEVRAIRRKLGLTQAAFARRFGFSVEAIRNYEQGLRQPPAPIRAYLRVIAAETEAVDRALAS